MQPPSPSSNSVLRDVALSVGCFQNKYKSLGCGCGEHFLVSKCFSYINHPTRSPRQPYEKWGRPRHCHFAQLLSSMIRPRWHVTTKPEQDSRGFPGSVSVRRWIWWPYVSERMRAWAMRNGGLHALPQSSPPLSCVSVSDISPCAASCLTQNMSEPPRCAIASLAYWFPLPGALDGEGLSPTLLARLTRRGEMSSSHRYVVGWGGFTCPEFALKNITQKIDRFQ